MTVAGNEIQSSGDGGRPAKAGFIQGLSLVLGSTLTVLAVIVLAPVLPQLIVAFKDVPNAGFWVPALVSVAALGAALFAPFAGFIGDRFGRRNPLIGFCIAFAILGFLPFVLDDFVTIFVARVAVGVSYMGILVLSTAMIGDCYAAESRGRWLGGQAIAATASALVFLPLGGLLGAWMGWRGPFLTFLLGVPFAFAYWAFFRNLREERMHDGPPVGWSALPWRWLLGICLVSVLAGILTFALQMQIGLALAAIGMTDAARIGVLSGIVFTGIPVGAFLFVLVASWPFRRLVCLQLLVLGATLMLLREIGDYRLFLGVAFVNLVAGGMVLPTFLTRVAQDLDGAVRARGIGVWQACFPVSQFLTVGICSLILRREGTTILDAFWVLGVIGIAAGAVGWIGPLGRRNGRLGVVGAD